ncbi:hypothetical protein PCASD_06807 [Puccinia coronata f. sp. avenae]|nr:hypothetical protein PCASD_06807 [Puccinia coronata f. sp. avenae]
MEPQSSPPAPTPAPAPGSDADILVDDSASNAPATRPASVAPEVPAGSMIVPGKHQTRQATRRQPAGSMSRSQIWARKRPEPARGRPEPAQLAS